MLFNSFVFIFLFLPAVLIIHYFLRQKSYQLSKVFLISGSLFFYGYWNPVYLILILYSIIFNFSIAAGISYANKKSRTRVAHLTLALGVAVNLGILAYFKYANFFVDSINSVFGSDWVLESVILPLAISFFTFQQITFLVDTKRRIVERPTFIDYSLFVTFFPQLIAGPIVHINEIVPQFLNNKKKIRYASNLAVGVAIFSIGLFKKVVLADGAENYVAIPFAAAATGMELTFLEAWGTALAFGFQIYFDFSGYSDMAIGLARMLGIRLPENFCSPYKSTSIIEFWRRWHMTLSRFLREYVYYPLGGNRLGRKRRYLNLMLTMLLGGLWHGAGWNFIFWGALHGFYLIVNHAWRASTLHLRAGVSNRVLRLPRPIATLLTLAAVAIAWVFFRAETFSAAGIITGAMLGSGDLFVESSVRFDPIFEGKAVAAPLWYQLWVGTAYWEGRSQLFYLLITGFICLALPNTQELFRRYRIVVDKKYPVHPRYQQSSGSSVIFFYTDRMRKILQWRVNFPSLIFTSLIALLSLLFLFQGKTGEFVYFQF